MAVKGGWVQQGKRRPEHDRSLGLSKGHSKERQKAPEEWRKAVHSEVWDCESPRTSCVVESQEGRVGQGEQARVSAKVGRVSESDQPLGCSWCPWAWDLLAREPRTGKAGSWDGPASTKETCGERSWTCRLGKEPAQGTRVWVGDGNRSRRPCELGREGCGCLQ